jgi:hypothetical protein
MSGSNASGNGVATTNFVGATSAIAQWMISNYTGYMWSASTIFAVNDMRTPIFYDSNNTGYYIDANGTSNLYNLNIYGAIGDGTPSLRLAPVSSSGSFQWASTAISSSLGAGQTMLHILGNALNTGNSGYLGYNYAGSNSASNFTSLGFYGNDNILRVYNGTYTQSLGSMRAPVFYDSDNTGRYLDPTGGSVLHYANFLRATSGSDANGLVALKIAGLSDYDSLELGVQSNYQAQIRTYGNDIHYYSGHWRTSGSTASENHQHYWYTSKSSSTNWSTWKMQLDHEAILYVTGQIRSPIFYDYDNTAYYVDPASTSNLNRVQIVQLYGNTECATSNNSSTSYSEAGLELRESQFGGSSSYLAPRLSFHWGGVVASQIGIESSGRITILNNPGTSYENLIGSILYGGASVRAPIFYETDNTSYYLDPANTLLSLNIAGNIECTARSASWAEGIRVNVPTAGTWGGIRFTRGASTGNWAIGFTGLNSTDDLTFYSGTASAIRLNLDHSGNLVAGGNITAYGSPSDRRLKENIQPLTGALSKVMQLQGCTFDWKEDSIEHTMVEMREDIGFIADEVRNVFPEMVREGGDGYLALRDRGFSAILVEAIKEQQTQIDELKALVKQLLNK